MAFPDVSERSLASLWSLEGRGVVVTGAARGIGFATASRLLEAGASVVLADRDSRALAAATARLSSHGTKVIAVEADVSDPASVGQLVAGAAAALPQLDGWVNNAVSYVLGPLVDASDEEWDTAMATNLRGVFLCCRQAGRHMASAAGGGGVVVNVTSTEAHRGMPRSGSYVTAKHGVLGLSRALAIELARHDVRVLTVAPTLVLTEGMSETVEAMGDAGRARWCDRLPAARLGVPDDVARVILFAISDMSMLMTGSVLLVDGGEMAGINRMHLL